ncbi:hypothetical protein [Gordonia sputi]
MEDQTKVADDPRRSGAVDGSREWCADFQIVLAFGRVLVSAEVIDDAASAVLDYVEKPWKFAPEYAVWEAVGNPTVGDVGWDAFCVAVAERS